MSERTAQIAAEIDELVLQQIDTLRSRNIWALTEHDVSEYSKRDFEIHCLFDELDYEWSNRDRHPVRSFISAR
jgi:hypothetical protein